MTDAKAPDAPSLEAASGDEAARRAAPEFRVDERSLLYPILEKHVWKPMLSWIPRTMSANTLTILGAVVSAVASASLIGARHLRVSWLLAALLYFAYLCLDNIDGPQARRTSGGTLLGEVLDHWLDSASGMLLFAAQLWAFQILDTRGLLVMALAAASYQATFWEQRVTGTMVLGKIGYVEGLVLLCGFCVVGAAIGPGILLRPLPAVGISLADVVFASAVVTLVWTVLAAVLRVRRRLGVLALLLLAPASIFALAALGSVPFPLAVCLFVLLTPATAGRLLIARTAGWRRFGIQGWIIGAVAAVTAGVLLLRPDPAVQTALLSALIAATAASVATDFATTLIRSRAELHPREMLGRLLRVRSDESRVEAGWPSGAEPP